MNRIKDSMTPRETSKRIRPQISEHQTDLQNYQFPSNTKIHGLYDVTNINNDI